jgi:hypothetical protein
MGAIPPGAVRVVVIARENRGHYGLAGWHRHYAQSRIRRIAGKDLLADSVL